MSGTQHLGPGEVVLVHDTAGDAHKAGELPAKAPFEAHGKPIQAEQLLANRLLVQSVRFNPFPPIPAVVPLIADFGQVRRLQPINRRDVEVKGGYRQMKLSIHAVALVQDHHVGIQIAAEKANIYAGTKPAGIKELPLTLPHKKAIALLRRVEKADAKPNREAFSDIGGLPRQRNAFSLGVFKLNRISGHGFRSKQRETEHQKNEK